MYQILDVSRSGYYAWISRPESHRKRSNRDLLERIKKIHKVSRETYGSPRVTKVLNNDGIKCGKNRVAKLMKENNIAAKTKKKFNATTNSKHSYPVAPNILNQDFKATKPNQIWVADITYIPTDEGWLYLAAIVYLFHRKVVGWAMDSTMTKQLCIDALNQAIGRCRSSRGLIHHSDRGVQYTSNEYKNVLKTMALHKYESKG